jgi:hypothetical protein
MLIAEPTPVATAHATMLALTMSVLSGTFTSEFAGQTVRVL